MPDRDWSLALRILAEYQHYWRLLAREGHERAAEWARTVEDYVTRDLGFCWEEGIT